MNIKKTICDDTQEMPHLRSTAFPRNPNKERWGTNNTKQNKRNIWKHRHTNKKKSATEGMPWNDTNNYNNEGNKY